MRRQRANLTAQLALLDGWIHTWVPDPAWSGNAAVDFEDWTPVWEENANPSGWHGKRYQDYSIELVQAAQPSLSLHVGRAPRDAAEAVVGPALCLPHC